MRVYGPWSSLNFFTIVLLGGPAQARDPCRSAQRAHSKLQKPPHTPAPESGMAAAATNTQWQERTAADVTRACSSSRPRRLPAGPTAGGFCMPSMFDSLEVKVL